MIDPLHGKQYAVLEGDCRTTMRLLPEKCVQLAFTSPPYFGLRDYQAPASVWGGDDPDCRHEWGDAIPGSNRGGSGTPTGRNGRGEEYARGAEKGQFCQQCGAWYGCLGAEPTPQLFVAHLVEVFREVKRVLRDDGCVFLNIADSYSSQGGPQVVQTRNSNRVGGSDTQNGGQSRSANTVPEKSLCLVPERLAIALSDEGWIIRNRCSWMKGCSYLPEWSGSVMPSSADDRFVVSEEPVWMLVKQPRYYFDQVAVREGSSCSNKRGPSTWEHVPEGGNNDGLAQRDDTGSRNPRSVWAIPDELYRLRDDITPEQRELVMRRLVIRGG